MTVTTTKHEVASRLSQESECGIWYRDRECVTLIGTNELTMPTQKLDRSLLEAAILGFESQKTLIDARIAELRQMLSGSPVTTATMPEGPTRKRKKFSAASRRKMALAQKARWAAIKGTTPATPVPVKPKRRISPEGMKRIIAATKKRWRLARAAKKA